MKIDSVSGQLVADCLGITRRQHTNLVKSGTLPKADAHRRYDLRASVRAFIEYRQNGAHKSLADEKRRETTERADSLAIKNAKLRGELVLVEHVGWMFNSLIAQMAAHLTALPGRAASALDGVTDAGRRREILLGETHAIRNAIADFCAQIPDAPPDLTKPQKTAIQSLMGVGSVESKPAKAGR